MADTDEIWSMITALKAPLYQYNFNTAPGSDASSGGGADLAVIYKQFSNIDTNNTAKNFYFLYVYGTMRMNLAGTLKIDRYTFNFVPSNNTVQLVDSAPSTTVGNKTTSSGVSTSISGSVGFFGGTGTGSVGGSKTVSSSVSYDVPDVTIQLLSDDGTGVGAESGSGSNGNVIANNARWQFNVDENSLVQSSDCSVKMNMIFSNDAKSDAQFGATFRVTGTVEIHVSDHDGRDGTRWFDTMSQQVSACLPKGSTFKYDNDRIGTITLPPWVIDINVPPLPSAG